MADAGAGGRPSALASPRRRVGGGDRRIVLNQPSQDGEEAAQALLGLGTEVDPDHLHLGIIYKGDAMVCLCTALSFTPCYGTLLRKWHELVHCAMDEEEMPESLKNLYRAQWKGKLKERL